MGVYRFNHNSVRTKLFTEEFTIGYIDLTKPGTKNYHNYTIKKYNKINQIVFIFL